MKKFFTLCCLVILSSLTQITSAQDRHEMDGMRVKINAQEHRNGRNVVDVTEGNKRYVTGRKSAYAISNTKALSKLAAPYLEFPIQSNMAGGTFQVTIGYRTDKDSKYKVNPQVIIGFDELGSEEVSLTHTNKTKQKKVDYKASALRGKKHVLKVWLPTKGVEIEYVEIRRKVINN